MSEPVSVDAAQLFEFIGGSPLAVVLVSVHPVHRFNAPLSEQLEAEHHGMALGTINLTDLVVAGGPALRFLHDGLRRCGAPISLGVLPGYCLFRGTELLAWQSGLPTLADLEAIARSAALGVLWASVTHNPSFIVQALYWAIEQVAAHRVAAAFRDALSAKRAARPAAAAPSSPPPVNELACAYRLLGVLPTASDREVHLAWRKKRMEAHPDYVVADPAEFERRSRLSAEINRARDIIVSHRSAVAHDAAYAKAS